MAKQEAEKKSENNTKAKVENVKKEEVKPAQPVQQKPVTNAPVNREMQRELQKQQRLLANLEVEVSKATKEKERLELALGAPENYTDKTKFAKVESDYKSASKTLQALNKEYETLFEKVMELEMQIS
jgi:ATP-binding cassette subfamily F protein 3